MTDSDKETVAVYRCPICLDNHHGKESRDNHAKEHPGVRPDAFARV